MKYICPKCQGSLHQVDHSYVCENRHSYDIAKEGYVNLLLVNQKRSKDPGDPKDSIQSRNVFLNKGYYQSLSDAINRIVPDLLPEHCAYLDAGCGTGYYLNRLMEACKGKDVDFHAVDIGKEAVKVSAKKNKVAHHCVGSVFHLPVEDGAFAMLMSVFCPYSAEEFSRIISPQGYVLAVMPGKRHLFELKSIVYDEPYENEEAGYNLPDFELVHKENVVDTITLQSQEDIHALWNMTPYVHKTRQEDSDKLLNYDTITTTTDFLVLLYRKKG